MKKKTAALFLAMALVVGATIGGTIAWLTATTTPVVNTFTTSDVDITLSEVVDTDEDGKAEFQMVPGCTITKDPKVKVTADSEDCYVFVKVEKTSEFDNYIEYAMAPDWTQLENNGEKVDGVFYRTVTTDEKGEDIPVIGYYKNGTFVPDKVLVKPTVTKVMMETINNDSSKQPKLTFTAYAIQLKKDNSTDFGPYEAWQEINPAGT